MNNYCNSCDSCNYCNYCDYCNYCNSCDYCDYCKNCVNLVNGFMCINLKLKEKEKDKYWIFNKEVTKEEWNKRWEIGKPKVCDKCKQEIKK